MRRWSNLQEVQLNPGPRANIEAAIATLAEEARSTLNFTNWPLNECAVTIEVRHQGQLAPNNVAILGTVKATIIKDGIGKARNNWENMFATAAWAAR